MHQPHPQPQPPDLHSLQAHKALIITQQLQAKQSIKSFFSTLTTALQHSQREMLRTLDQEMLTFHEAVSSVLKTIIKSKGTLPADEAENAQQILKCKLMHGSKVNEQQLVHLLSSAYYVKVGTPLSEDSKIELPSLGESERSGCAKLYDQATVQKIQGERDYYQRREEELQQRLREWQVSRKGTNIRELSKSALQEKCSKWAIQRLKEEKRILIERLGQASQQLMKQQAVACELQEEIRRLSGMEGGSMAIINSTIRNGSVIGESEVVHERSEQLQAKNGELMIQLTACMQKYQALYSSNQQLEKQHQQLNHQCRALQGQISEVRMENAMINKDYEGSLRKKAAIEQQYTQFKQAHNVFITQSEEERQALRSLIEGLQAQNKQVKEDLRRVQGERKAELSVMQQKTAQLAQERQKLLRKLQEASSKTGEETNYKQLLNDEIGRLLKQNAALEKEVQSKEDSIFEARQALAKAEAECKEATKKTDSAKKQHAQMKKTIKELQKQNGQIKAKLLSAQSLQQRVAELQQLFSNLHGQFIRCKQGSERRTNIHSKTVGTLKERFALQLAQLLQEDGKKGKGIKSKGQLIEKCIEEMVAFSSKTAQIKQLKEEVRELREGKEGKKTRQKTLEESVGVLEQQMWSTTAKIFEERLSSEKIIFEQRLNQMGETLKKEEILRKGLGEELERERAAISQLKAKNKSEKAVEQVSKAGKQNEQRIQRLQQQLKRVRGKCKKLEGEAGDAQSQLKTKKDLIAGLRNQVKAKEDTIIQLYKEVDSLKGQIDKYVRNTRQMGNKEQLLREVRQSFRKAEEEREELAASVEQLGEKNRQLLRQLGKKEEVIRELSSLQDRENKKREDLLVKSLNLEIVDLRETLRKAKIDNDRKDEINKNTKAKLQAKNKEIQEALLKYERAVRQKEGVDRKWEATSSGLKKEQVRSGQLCWIIKKVFQLCCGRGQREEGKGRPETTQYYSQSSVSPHTLKLGTPASNLKSLLSCEGLQILNLRPEDLSECLGEATSIVKTDYGENWSMSSPIVNKRKAQQEREGLMEGLEELERLLSGGELGSGAVLDQFKSVLLGK